MATDFFLIQGKDMKRLGTRGGGNNFYWLVDPVDIQMIFPFEVWDDYGNNYTRDEFNMMLGTADNVLPKEEYGYDNPKVDFPNGTEDGYWDVKKNPDWKPYGNYKARVTGTFKEDSNE